VPLPVEVVPLIDYLSGRSHRSWGRNLRNKEACHSDALSEDVAGAERSAARQFSFHFLASSIMAEANSTSAATTEIPPFHEFFAQFRDEFGAYQQEIERGIERKIEQKIEQGIGQEVKDLKAMVQLLLKKEVVRISSILIFY